MQTISGEPLVSVILPTFNRCATIRRAIDSILQQTYKNFELIIVDDGSTDETIKVVSEYTDPRIRLLRSKKNEGASIARNKGINEAKGDFLAFQDSDDEWLPQKLKIQLLSAQRFAQFDFYFCTLIRISRSDHSARLIPDFDVPQVDRQFVNSLLLRNFIWTQTWLVRKKVFESGVRFDPKIIRVQDWDFVLQVAKQYRIMHVNEALALAHETAGSLLSLQQQKGLDLRLLLKKHATLYSKCRVAKAKHMRTIAYLAAIAGDNKDLRLWAKLAWLQRPMEFRSWRLLISAMFGSFIVNMVLANSWVKKKRGI